MVNRKMSALAHQVNMNNFLSLLVGASLVAANSSPNHDLNSFSQPTEFSNGVSSFALPAEDRMAFDSYTLAYLNYSFVDTSGLENHEGELIGKFGEGRVLNRTGLLVHVTKSDDPNEHRGCSKDWNGTKGQPLPASGIPWIALILRGNCNFEEKVKHAYMHGAAGVIIYNDKDDPRLDKMKINDKERNITAVFTTKAKGHELIDILERQGYEVTIAIIEGSRHIRSLANINRTSVLFVSVSFIVLMIISLVWLVFYYVQRFRYLQTKDKQSRRLCNVAKRIIAKIPTKSIKSDDKEIDNDCCAICIEPYKVTDVIRVLPCKHEFHKTCIDPWLLEHRTCPMCKMDILKHYGFVVGSSHGSSSSSASSSSARTTQNNPIIADYFSVAVPPPPPSNSSTITSSVASVGGPSAPSRVLVAGDSTSNSGSSSSSNSSSGSSSEPDQIVTIIININSGPADSGSSTTSSVAVPGGSSGSSSNGLMTTATTATMTEGSSRQITDV